MKREPYSVNTTPSTDPPRHQPAESWLDNDPWGEMGDDPFGSNSPSPLASQTKNTQDPFADMGFDDPFAKQTKSSRSQSPKRSVKENRREEEIQAQRRQQVLRQKQATEYKRRQAERDKQAALQKAHAQQLYQRQQEELRQQEARKRQEELRQQEARRRQEELRQHEARRRQEGLQQQEARRRQEELRQQEARRRQEELRQLEARRRQEELRQQESQRQQEARRRKQVLAKQEQFEAQRQQRTQAAFDLSPPSTDLRSSTPPPIEQGKQAVRQSRGPQVRTTANPAWPESSPPQAANPPQHSRQPRNQTISQAPRVEVPRAQVPQTQPLQAQSPHSQSPRATYKQAKSTSPQAQAPSNTKNLVSVQQLQNILIPMHQLMRKQDEEIKRLKGELKQEANKSKQALKSLQASQVKSLPQEHAHHSNDLLKAEFLKLKALVTEQSKQIKQAQAQAMQASAMVEMGQSSFQAPTRSSWSLGNLSSGLNQMMGKLSSSFGKLTPKRPKTFEEIKALTSSKDLPLPPPVPVYDPFAEQASLEDDNNSHLDMEHWKSQDELLLNTPVVTNAPQAIPSVELDENQDDNLEISFDFDDESNSGNDSTLDSNGEKEGSESSKSANQQLAPAEPVPVMGNNDPQALQFNVGGLTMSRFQSAGPDPQLMSMIMQHTQLLKRQEYNSNQLSGRIKKQEEMNQSQNEIIEQLLSRTQREQDKLTKRVKKLERAKDISQKNAGGLKAHHKRLSQLEMLIEGFEAKLAAFDEKLSAKDPSKQATDIRVSLDPDEGDYQSIQEAIDAAPVGAYIGIMPGIYQDPLEITKPVKLIGLGRPQDILIQVKEESALSINRMGGVYEESMSSAQEKEVRKKLQGYTGIEASTVGSQVMKWFKRQLGQPVADDSVFEAKVGTDEVSLVSLTVSSITTEVGGTPSERPAILVRSGHLRIEKCEVRCENGHGIVLEGESAELTTRASRIIQTRGSGLLLRTRAQATLASTAIVKCKEAGIDGQGYTSIRLMDCDISNNQRIGVQVGFKSQLIAYHTIMSGNHFEGLWMNNQSTGTVKGCDLRGNARGPYDISTDCRVEMLSNKP